MLDPANFGTPLTLLQIPARSIQRIQEKLTSDGDCAVTHYSQDCRRFSDLRKSVAADDWTVARRITVDVGYICRRCHIVYPGRTSCAGHQEAQCYRDVAAPRNAIVKLEQVQYECSACRLKASTIAEYKTHCAGDWHRKAAAAWIRVHAAAAPASQQPSTSAAAARPESADPPRTAAVTTSASVIFNTPANQDTKPEDSVEEPPSNPPC